ncbi:MAG: 50S ribosomal protein L32 [Patescibacteria group bacterium]
MGVPRGRRTKSKRGHRRSHLALKVLGVAACAHCGAKNRPHTVCSSCGFYKGRQVVDVTAKAVKKGKKSK